MASNYPGSLDSFDAIASDKKTSDTVGGRTHRAMHNDLGDAIEAVQTELGTNPSGSDATVAARLAAIEAGTNLDDGAILARHFGADTQPGNLLTANQASVETGSLTSDGSISYGSGAATVSGSPTYILISPAEVAVDAGATYTAHVRLTPTGTAYVGIVWRNSSHADMATSAGNTLSGAGVSTVTAVAPAGAAYAVWVVYPTGASVVVSEPGVWRGAGGEWQMPGVPIPNLGRQVTHPNTDDVLVQVWDSTLGRWQTVWYDSGWRDVSGLLVNSWIATTLRMRRVNSTVMMRFYNLRGGSGAVFTSQPSGFAMLAGTVPCLIVTGTGFGGFSSDGTSLTPCGTVTDPNFETSVSWHTDAAIPTSLPGTLISAAPA